MSKRIIFKNKIFNKKKLKEIVYDAFQNYGITRSCSLADEIKNLGFNYATKAGISISIEDLKVPPKKKNLIIIGNKEIINSELAYYRGEINFVERFQKIIDIWSRISETLKNELVRYFSETDPLNPIYLMAFSGARGNLSQVRQLVGMRGLMSDPSGQIIDIPIIHNFREGLTITDYIMSAYGARKGVVDTALRTADSGYLTRRLIDVAQDVIIREYDCNTKYSIKIYKDDDEIENFEQQILGRTNAENIYSIDLKALILEKDQIITEKVVEKIFLNKIKAIKIKSPLTCESARSICQKCYGWDLSNCKIIKLGEAIGIVAAQSIGEPGTQLTMRTFHTGGVFTSDISRQILAKKNGFFQIAKNSEIIPSRTLYGREIEILERETNFIIIDYENKKHYGKLKAGTNIFVKNNSFVIKDELLAELSYKNEQRIKSRKNLIALHSGELIFSEKKNLFWILRGEVYNVPSNNLINKFKKNQQISQKDNLSSVKLISRKEGVLKTILSKTKNVNKLQISNCLEKFINYPILWDNKRKKLYLILNFPELTEYYELFLLNNNNKKTNLFKFGEQITTKYNTETGGEIILLNNSFFQYESKYNNKIIVKNGKLLFIPLENYKIEKDKAVLLVPNNTKLDFKHTEIISGIFSQTDGFVQTKESNNIIEEVNIKAGKFFEFMNLKPHEINDLKKIDKKIFFKNEIVFEDIIVEFLSLAEVIKIKNFYGLLLRKIEEYNIPKTKKSNKTKKKELEFKRISIFNYKTEIIRQNTSLINVEIWLENNEIKFKNDINFSYVKRKKNWTIKKFINEKNLNKISEIFSNSKNEIDLKCCNDAFVYLIIINEKNFDISNLLSKQVNKEDFKLSLFNRNFSYINKNTIVGNISLMSKKSFEIKEIKTNEKERLKLLFFTKKNYKTYYNENNYFLKKINEIIKIGDKLTPLIKVNCSGKIIEKKPFKLKLHKIIPFFINLETKLYIRNKDYIKEEDILGEISFEQIITGDIIQGLPKIEEILEARKPQNPALLNESPGIVFKMEDNQGKGLHLKIYINKLIKRKPKQVIETYPIEENKNEDIENKIIYKSHYKEISEIKKRLTIKENDFIYIGQALTEGCVNPHNLLLTYFSYYKNFTSYYEATCLSVKNIQLLLIEKIQQVYILQDVTIADKHLEVIIKKISSKVQIITSGDSFLLPNEIIELKQIEYINFVLKESKNLITTYQPILLGITKASLLSDSFISAASFQETTKILTAAAIEGKIDWLRGLKENIIIGRLIPVGTGYNEETTN
jgi:DNA-directed RNA polymerase subunit beta'